MTTLKQLNKPESKHSIIRRLTREANRKAGKQLPQIGAALEYRRDAYGLSATEFAGILGMLKSHYSEVVNGRRQLPFNATRRAFAIGVPADILLRQ